MTLAQLPHINLPAYGAQIQGDGVTAPLRIYDVLRRKWVALTPEEWVRQHFVNYLIRDLGYSPFRMSNERGLVVGARHRRTDTLVYSNDMRVLMVIEYNAPHIPLTQNVIEKIARYNLAIRAPYLVVTNGLKCLCLHIDSFGDTHTPPQVTQLPSLPPFSSLL